MKQIRISFLLVIVTLISCQDKEKSNLTLLDNQKPTTTPTIFAPNIISLDKYSEASITFNPDMNELFFQRKVSIEGSHNIYTMKLIDGKWSEPKLASFSAGLEHLELHPRLSQKGDRLYFGSRRPLNDSTESTGFRQWQVENNNGIWGVPKLLLPELFDDKWIMCVSPTMNGNLYFTSKEKEDKMENEANYYTMNNNGRYGSILRMNETVNFPGKWRAHPFIAPDESYIIFDAETTDIPDNGDLFISFNNSGTWSKVRSLGSKINTEMSETCATVSPNGKYLFFQRGAERKGEDGSTYWESDIYWVDFNQLKKEILKNANSN